MMRQTAPIWGLFFLVAVTACYSGQESGGDELPLISNEGAAPKVEAAKDDNDEGVIRYGQKFWSMALENFEKALAKDPDYAVAHFNMGVTLDKMGRHQDATEHFKKAKELDPNNTKIQNSKMLKQHLKI